MRRRALKRWINKLENKKTDFSSLHYAVFYNNTALIKILVRHGGDLQVKNNLGSSLLHMAA